jgi:hypothetical protein
MPQRPLLGLVWHQAALLTLKDDIEAEGPAAAGIKSLCHQVAPSLADAFTCVVGPIHPPLVQLEMAAVAKGDEVYLRGDAIAKDPAAPRVNFVRSVRILFFAAL